MVDIQSIEIITYLDSKFNKDHMARYGHDSK